LQFQSSPGLVTGRYLRDEPLQGLPFVVSILARSGDRALRHFLLDVGRCRAVFQSSPGLVTGRYDWSKVSACVSNEFQSSPGLVTGRYHINALTSLVSLVVSILARSGDRALLDGGRLTLR